jgi:hypothetical protein
MIAPYVTDPNRNIKRPRRPGDPEPVSEGYRFATPPVAAPPVVIPAPPERDVTLPDPNALPMPQADAAGAAPAMSTPTPNIPADTPGDPKAYYMASKTRHGVGGRIKDFLESLLYSGGNPIAAGVAAASPGKLAQWKYNMIEQPQVDRRRQVEGEQENLRQQSLLRAAQARKAQSDEQEDTLTRDDRLNLIRANTRKAQAEATEAERPRPLPQRNAQILDADSPNIMQVDPATGYAIPVLGADGKPVGRYRPPVKPEPTLTPYQQYQVGRDVNQDAEKQREKGAALLDDFEKVKKNVTALDAEKNEMADASGQKPNAKGMVSYKGHDYLPAELLSMAKQKEADWRAAQAEFSGMRQKVAAHPALELDDSGVGARYKKSAPQANAPSGKTGKVPVISSAKIGEAAQRKGMSPEQFKEWFASVGGVIQ